MGGGAFGKEEDSGAAGKEVGVECVGGNGAIFANFFGDLAVFFCELGDSFGEGLVLFEELLFFVFGGAQGGFGEAGTFFGATSDEIGGGNLGSKGGGFGFKFFLGLAEGGGFGAGGFKGGASPFCLEACLLGEAEGFLFFFLEAFGEFGGASAGLIEDGGAGGGFGLSGGKVAGEFFAVGAFFFEGEAKGGNDVFPGGGGLASEGERGGREFVLIPTGEGEEIEEEEIAKNEEEGFIHGESVGGRGLAGSQFRIFAGEAGGAV